MTIKFDKESKNYYIIFDNRKKVIWPKTLIPKRYAINNEEVVETKEEQKVEIKEEVKFEIKEEAKEVIDVISIDSYPKEVIKDTLVDVNLVKLNVKYSDNSTGVEIATSVICDTSTLGTTNATAWYNAIGYKDFTITVIE